MAAPPGSVVRHALTVGVILTRLFALVEAQAFAGGLSEVDLAGVGVAFRFRARRHPSTHQTYRGCESVKRCRQNAVCVVAYNYASP